MRVLVTGRGGGLMIAGLDAVQDVMRRIGDRGDGDADGAGGGRGGGGRAAVGGGGGDVEGEALHFAVADQVEPAELGRGQRVAPVIVERARGEPGATVFPYTTLFRSRVGIDLRQ